MKAKLKLFLSAIIVFFYSCAGPSSLYEVDYPLLPDLTESKTTDLKVHIPRGWFTAEDNRKEIIDLWLVRDDYNASISFITINPDEETIKSSAKSILQKIENYSRLNNKIAHQNKFIDLLKNEVFEMNGREFRAYQFNGSGNLYRVVVFKYKGKYFESIAAIKPGQSSETIAQIFTVQNSVLNSIK